MKARVKKAGWAHGREERIDLEAVREVVIRRELKTAAERAVTSALCNEAIDKILANHWLILPSREVKTQKHYSGSVPTITYRASSIDGGGVDHGRGIAAHITSPAREDALSIRTRSGWTGKPVGRPRKEEPTRSQGRAARLRRARRFDGTPQPAGISAVDWGMLRLSYVDDVTAVELGERFTLRPEVVRKRLSRARQAATTEGHELPK